MMLAIMLVKGVTVECIKKKKPDAVLAAPGFSLVSFTRH
jgi:hypothetical protein